MSKNIKCLEENVMRFIMCFQKKHKVKVINKSNTLDSLIMIGAICKTIVEKIAIEKGMKTGDALRFVVDSICESYNSLN
jgi:hypothetical protein|nr:MAG TPA: hypothetical protein [Caudoviricetes sp.]